MKNRGCIASKIGLVLLIILPATIWALEFVGRESGEIENGKFGRIVVELGDVNNDGFTDFAVGAPGLPQSKNFSGRVYIFLGGNNADLKPDYTLVGENPGDTFGSAITRLGDINNDGFEDFAIGAKANDEAGEAAGKVYIWKGGLQIDSSPYYTLLGKRASENFGAALAGGKDINADGNQDLLIGASYGGQQFSGCVYIYLGPLQAESISPDRVLNGENMGDLFGSSIMLHKDITGDQIADFLVGAYYAGVNDKSAAGKAYLFSGGNIIPKDPRFKLEGKNESGWFGYSFAEINNFYPDAKFAVGAPRGGSQGGGEIILSNKEGKTVFKISEESKMAGLGFTMAELPDLNGDNYRELIVGLPYVTDAGLRSGMAKIFYGGKKPDTTSDLRIPGRFAGAEFGSSVSYIDGFYGNGEGIIIIGAPNSGNIGYIEVYK